MTARLRSDELAALRERDGRKGWRNYDDKIEQADAVAALIDRHRLLTELDAEYDHSSRLNVALHGILALAQSKVLRDEDVMYASRVMTGLPTDPLVCTHPEMFRRKDELCVVCRSYVSKAEIPDS